MNDLITLLRLEAKRLKSKAAYWLRVLGMDPNDTHFYRIYVGLFWLYWVFFMWAYATETVYQMSRALPLDVPPSVGQGLPLLIFAGQVFYLFMLFRKQPVRLSGADIAYLAISPVHRGALMWVNLVRNTWLPTLGLAVVSCLLGMFMTFPTSPDYAGFAGLYAAIVMLFIVYTSAAVAWALALYRWQPRATFGRQALWAIFPAVILLALWLPQVGLWPGHVWASVALDTPTLPLWLVLVALSVIATLMLVLSARRVDMPVIIEANQMYARIARLGPYAGYYARDLIARIQKQHQLMKKKRIRYSLSTGRGDFALLLSQAVLMSVRVSSLSPLMLVGQGLLIGSLAGTLLSVSGLDQIQTWAVILLALMMSRRPDIVSTFRSAMQQTWLRQFLPVPIPHVLAAHSLFPFALIYVGCVIALGLSIPAHIPMISLFVLVIGLILTICQAFEIIPETNVFKRTLPYETAVLVCGIPIVLVGFVSQDAFVTLAAALAVLGILGYLLHESYPVF